MQMPHRPRIQYDPIAPACQAHAVGKAWRLRYRFDLGYWARGPRRLRFASGKYVRRQSHRSEEHTSELQSLMRISYAVFCLKKKKQKQTTRITRDRHRKK